MAETIDEIIQRIKKEEDVFSKARLTRYLLKERSLKVKDLAEKLGIKPSYVCHINRLNRLPDIIIDAYYSKLVTVSHLFLLSRIEDFKKMVEIYEEILTRGLSIKETEDSIREHLYGIKNKGKYLKEEQRIKLEEAIDRKYPGVKSKIIQTRVYGKLNITIKGGLDQSTKVIRELSERLSN